MTDGERFALAVALSLAVHWASARPIPEATTSDAIDLGAFEVASAAVGTALAPPIAVEAATPNARDPSADAADRRLQARRAYVEQLSDAIHARRMARASGGRLVGNAVFVVEIGGDGRFTRIEMQHGSGEGALDADARHAVETANGVVPRPRLLGRDPLTLTVVVKYQFGL